VSKQSAADSAVEAGAVAAAAINMHGLDSPQAAIALQVAHGVTEGAKAQGCTKADFEAAHARRS
jgi:hypothetical protein